MPHVNLDDTIAAVATASGVGAIGIVRLSGKEAISIADRLVQFEDAKKHLSIERSHTIHYGKVVDGDGQVVDDVLISVFRSPHSYTGEDTIEISAHGSPKILQSILNRAIQFGARQAEPGEFTRRAFLNGRMDLTQAEAVADLISARTDRAVQLAVRQLNGELSNEIHKIKEDLLRFCAHMEAYLDFPEDDIEVYSNDEFRGRFESIGKRLRDMISTFRKGELLREGALAVIVGRPNVGKSSILNALLARDRAIVSDIPGTTRDTLEESIVLDGLWVRLVDTAGLGESRDRLDAVAMERTRRYLTDADIFLFVVDNEAGMLDADKEILRQIKNQNVIVVVNKIDRAKKISSAQLSELVGSEDAVFISAKTGEGINGLEKRLAACVLTMDAHMESAVITRARHKHALELALERLEKSRAAFQASQSLEFVVLDLKAALDALRELVGEVYTDDLLDMIFREFCIGK